jgi:hypothetical protein
MTQQDVRGRCKSRIQLMLRTTTAITMAVWSACPAARATDIIGVQPAALDQPRINALIRPAPSADPLYADIFGTRAFNVSAFFDTGASGVLLSRNTASFLGELHNPGVAQDTYNGKQLVFEDVGVAGADRFNVSIPVHISIAPSTPGNDERIALAEEQLNNNDPASFEGVDLSPYRQSFGPIRAQVGPLTSDDPNEPNDNPLLSDLDVFGMPLMRGKVVVMDPRPVENLFSGNIDNGFLMKTHVYNPGTPFNKDNEAEDPGIPDSTSRTIKLSYGSFEKFTRTGTADTATGPLTPLPPGDVANYRPTLEHNPFIGPNPVNPAGDPTPPVKITYGNQSTTGSFLLDTGAAASMISSAKANALGITLDESDPENPVLIGVPRDEQFTLTIGGIGGTKKVPGFYLSSMLLRAQEGNAANDNDPNHIRFIDAPVLVIDIALKDPDSSQTLTLDGIFGMNFLVATAYLSEGGAGGFPVIDLLTPGAFDYAVFDEPNGTLKLRPRIPGDANRDGVVDFNDLAALAQNYNSEGENLVWDHGDFNGDQVIDFNDLAMLAQHYNSSTLLPSDIIQLPNYPFSLGGAPVSGAVPEPATALAIVGLTFTLTRRRRV